jgi:hypothetical protein
MVGHDHSLLFVFKQSAQFLHLLRRELGVFDKMRQHRPDVAAEDSPEERAAFPAHTRLPRYRRPVDVALASYFNAPFLTSRLSIVLMVRGFHPDLRPSASTISLAVTGAEDQTVSITIHSASDIRGSLGMTEGTP